MICVSIGNISFHECMKVLDSEELAEIRMDLLNFNDKEFNEIFGKDLKLVATCRPVKGISEQQRVEKLKQAISGGAKYIDIEYEADETTRKELVHFAKENNCRIIISYHNYDLTPEINELQSITKQTYIMGADVAKLATMANSYEDNDRILSLYSNNKPLVAFCMGDEGKLSRVKALKLGAEFTFASLNKEQATAPGQLTKEEINNILENLKTI